MQRSLVYPRAGQNFTWCEAGDLFIRNDVMILQLVKVVLSTGHHFRLNNITIEIAKEETNFLEVVLRDKLYNNNI